MVQDHEKRIRRTRRRRVHLTYILMFCTGFSLLRIFLSGKNKENSSELEEGMEATPTRNFKQQDTSGIYRTDVALVFTVHGALDYFQQALVSLEQHTVPIGGRLHVFVADDCGNQTESQILWEMLNGVLLPSHVVQTAENSRGYTRAINAGLREAMADGFEIMVVLNSDVVFGPRWLEPLVAALKSNESIGVAGPLGNAASYQNVPRLSDSNGKWSTNPPPIGWTSNLVAAMAGLISRHELIGVPMLNGFVMAVHRRVLETVGLMDEKLFPTGYGEENDFAFRVTNAGFQLVVQPASYVYHHKTKSFTVEERTLHNREGQNALKTTWGRELKVAAKAMAACPHLLETRTSFAQHLSTMLPLMRKKFSILFILDAMPSSRPFVLRHDWILIVHDALGLKMSGAFVRLAVQHWAIVHFLKAFPNVPRDAFLGFEGLTPGDAAREILQGHFAFNFVVATQQSTVETMLIICARYPSTVKTYYMYDRNTQLRPWSDEGVFSSGRMEDRLVLTKSSHLQREIRTNFDLDAILIHPSINSSNFHSAVAEKQHRNKIRSRLNVCALVHRESTPWQTNKLFEVLLGALAALGPENVVVRVFVGRPSFEFRDMLKDYPRYSKFTKHVQIEEEPPTLDHAQIYRACDVLLDFSGQHSLGRYTLEAMASGCIPILPYSESAEEYVIHGENAVLVDSTRVQDGIGALVGFSSGTYNITKMQENAVVTSKRFDIQSVGSVTAAIFRDFLSAWLSKRSYTTKFPIKEC